MKKILLSLVLATSVFAMEGDKSEKNNIRMNALNYMLMEGLKNYTKDNQSETGVIVKAQSHVITKAEDLEREESLTKNNPYAPLSESARLLSSASYFLELAKQNGATNKTFMDVLNKMMNEERAKEEKK